MKIHDYGNCNLSAPFSDRVPYYTERIAARLQDALPESTCTPQTLHEAMRYAVLNGGKRVRPLLVYATGECLGVSQEKLDPPAAAVELIHAFSLIHDDLPAMDDDDLRRGMPTVHRKFDEATAILAADALQPLAFSVMASAGALSASERVGLIGLIADACGSLGMTGGQSIDLASEGRSISPAELEEMHRLKTGALIEACVMSAHGVSDNRDEDKRLALQRFAGAIGLAFQIRDDILDVAGQTAVIGKRAGSDQQKGKATWPATFGLDESQERCSALLSRGLSELDVFADGTEPLRWLATYIVERLQ